MKKPHIIRGYRGMYWHGLASGWSRHAGGAFKYESKKEATEAIPAIARMYPLMAGDAVAVPYP